MTTMKFHMLTFLNYLAGGDECSLSIFDQKVSIKFPELVLLGEPNSLLGELKSTSVFLKNSDAKLELLHCTEVEGAILAEIRVPSSEGPRFAALCFSFSDAGIQSIRAYYPCDRSLQIASAEEPVLSRLPVDIELLKKFLEKSEFESFLNLFEKDVCVQNEYGEMAEGEGHQLNEIYKALHGRALTVHRLLDSGRLCAIELSASKREILLCLLRSENRLISGVRLYANRGISSKTQRAPFTDLRQLESNVS